MKAVHLSVLFNIYINTMHGEQQIKLDESTCLPTYLCMYVCIHMYVYMDICTRMYVYICIYAYVYDPHVTFCSCVRYICIYIYTYILHSCSV
jgi:hypothetical protein